MAGKRDFHKLIIGRSEMLSFVDLDLHGVPAKTDTGAYRSTVHASDIHLDESTGVLSFVVLGNHPQFGVMQRRVETTEFSTVWIESSTGHGQNRYEVKLRVKIGPKIFKASFSLADRAARIYPVLIGRQMLNDRFLVDTSLTGVDRVELREKLGIDLGKDEEGEYEDSYSV